MSEAMTLNQMRALMTRKANSGDTYQSISGQLNDEDIGCPYNGGGKWSQSYVSRYMRLVLGKRRYTVKRKRTQKTRTRTVKSGEEFSPMSMITKITTSKTFTDDEKFRLVRLVTDNV